MTLLTYESLTRERVRTDPAALATWIRYRFVRWLTGVSLSKSQWTYKTDTELLVPVGLRGAATQKLTLHDSAGLSMSFDYHFSGASVPIGMPLLQADNRGFQESKTGRSIWTPGKVQGDGHGDNLRTLAGMKRAVLIDLHALFGRRTEFGPACGAVLLFGLDAHCAAWIRKIGFHTYRLLEAVSERRRSIGGYSFDDVRDDVDTSFQEVGFQGALFFDGLTGATSPLVAYFGELPNATAEAFTGPGTDK